MVSAPVIAGLFPDPAEPSAEKRNERDLLYWMGWETANIHLGTVNAKKLAKQLKRKPAGWLERAATAMSKATKQDWKDWGRKK